MYKHIKYIQLHSEYNYIQCCNQQKLIPSVLISKLKILESYHLITFVCFSTGYWLPSYKLQHSWATGLHLSVLYGHLESLRVLLKHKATINCRPNGKAAIHIACEVANLDCVNILCSHGAKTNCYSLSGFAPLHYCTTKISLSCAQQLIWKGKLQKKQS